MRRGIWSAMNAIEPEEAPVCQHFQRAAELLGKRWNTKIIRVLLSGVSRFTDVREAVPSISDAALRPRRSSAAELAAWAERWATSGVSG